MHAIKRLCSFPQFNMFAHGTLQQALKHPKQRSGRSNQHQMEFHTGKVVQSLRILLLGKSEVESSHRWIIRPKVQHSETDSGPALPTNLKMNLFPILLVMEGWKTIKSVFRSIRWFSEMPVYCSIASLNNQAQFSNPLPQAICLLGSWLFFFQPPAGWLLLGTLECCRTTGHLQATRSSVPPHSTLWVCFKLKSLEELNKQLSQDIIMSY